MARLEDLTPGAVVRGVLVDQPVTVVAVKWHGTAALTLTHRDDQGQVREQLLYRASEQTLSVEETGPAWSFSADGELFRLASEARRIQLAYLFDPLLAVTTSNVMPLPLTIASLAALTARGPAWQITSAHSRAVDITASGLTTLFTRPMRYASCASIGFPISTSSAALHQGIILDSL